VQSDQLLHPLVEDLDDPRQGGGALLRRGVAPLAAPVCGERGGHGAVGVLHASAGSGRGEGLRGGVDHVVALLGVDPFPTDVHREVRHLIGRHAWVSFSATRSR
jgi:hypothetical protein